MRGLGLVAARSGDRDGAARLLGEAAEAAGSLPDVYAWCEALALTDLVELENGRDAEHNARALSIARRGPMPDLVARLSVVVPAQTRGQRPAREVSRRCLTISVTTDTIRGG